MKRPILVAIFAATLASPALGGPIYMKIEGVDGDVSSPVPGAFEIQTSQLDQVERMAAQKAPRGGQNILIQISSINFSKRQDKASLKLQQASAKGQHFPRAVITVRKAGGETNYLTVKLEDCLVSGYQTSAHAGADRPTESISINFAKMSVDYKPQGSPVLVGDPHSPANKIQGSAQPAAPKN